MFKISFVIPSYNSFKTIPKTLESIGKLKSYDLIEEIIVIDCSDDLTTRAILSNYPEIKLKIIQLQEKSSPGNSRNIGAKTALGDVLCFIDSDVFLDPLWLDHISYAYQSGCRVGGGSVGIPSFQSKNLLALAQLYLQFNEYLQVGQTRQIKLLPACNMFVDRQLFNQLNGFPQIRASEDVIFCLKAAEQTAIWFIPAAHSFHIFREETRPYLQNQIVLGTYIIVYRRMMYEQWYYKQLWPILLLPLFLIFKTARITTCTARAGRHHLNNFIWSFPLFLAGLFYWGIGFYQGTQRPTIPRDK